MTEEVGEHGIAARLGGDEFAIVLTGLADAQQAELLADRLLRRLLVPAALSTATVTVGAASGWPTGDALTAGDLMRCADVAMYSAKAKGKNRVERFDPLRHGHIADVRQLEDHLAYALRGEEISVQYQPVVDLKTGHCVAAEALVRWQHPHLGTIDPERFLPLAARIGRAVEIDVFVLRTALREAADWVDPVDGAPLPLAVNVASASMASQGFAGLVRAELEAAGTDPGRVTLELTETELLAEEQVQRELNLLADLGVRIAVDDFGAGVMSLGYLQSMRVDAVKIDRALLEQRDETRMPELVQLIMAVGQFLRLDTVAERVETAEHLDWARSAGIAQAQGNLIAAPMPAADLGAWIATRDAYPALGPGPGGQSPGA